MTPPISGLATQTDISEPTGAYEIFKIVGRELQFSKERIKALEAALAQRESPNPEPRKELMNNAEKADSRVKKLEEDLKESQSQNVRLNSKISRLHSRIDRLKAVKKEQAEPKDQVLSIEANPSAARVSEMEEKLKGIAEEKEELAKKLDDLDRENALCKMQLQNIETEKNAIAASSHLTEDLNKVWTIEKYTAFTEAFPELPGRPNYTSLRPICHANADLRGYLESDDESKWLTQSIICLPSPGRLLWTSTTCKIGLAFGPMHQYQGKHGWVKQSEFSGRYGKELEVFFMNGDHIYYAGRYLCMDIRARNPQGCFRTGSDSAEALADISFPSRVAGPQAVHDALWSTIRSLYMNELLRAECAILRCVGFSHDAHDTLSAKYDVLNNLERRRASERSKFDPPRAPKKGRAR